jgi:hypothetical protein
MILIFSPVSGTKTNSTLTEQGADQRARCMQRATTASSANGQTAGARAAPEPDHDRAGARPPAPPRINIFPTRVRPYSVHSPVSRQAGRRRLCADARGPNPVTCAPPHPLPVARTPVERAAQAAQALQSNLTYRGPHVHAALARDIRYYGRLITLARSRPWQISTYNHNYRRALLELQNEGRLLAPRLRETVHYIIIRDQTGHSEEVYASWRWSVALATYGPILRQAILDHLRLPLRPTPWSIENSIRALSRSGDSTYLTDSLRVNHDDNAD